MLHKVVEITSLTAAYIQIIHCFMVIFINSGQDNSTKGYITPHTPLAGTSSRVTYIRPPSFTYDKVILAHL